MSNVLLKKDIAGVLAYCEAHCDNDDELDVVRWVAEKFAEAIEGTNDPVAFYGFMTLALPIEARQPIAP